MSMWRKHKSGARAGLQDPLLRLEIQRWKMASMGGGGLLEKQRRMVEKLGLEPLRASHLKALTKARQRDLAVDFHIFCSRFSIIFNDFQLFSIIFSRGARDGEEAAGAGAARQLQTEFAQELRVELDLEAVAQVLRMTRPVPRLHHRVAPRPPKSLRRKAQLSSISMDLERE